MLGGVDSVPGWGTMIPHAERDGQKKRKITEIFSKQDLYECMYCKIETCKQKKKPCFWFGI